MATLPELRYERSTETLRVQFESGIGLKIPAEVTNDALRIAMDGDDDEDAVASLRTLVDELDLLGITAKQAARSASHRTTLRRVRWRRREVTER